jgi:hypothetical protein
MFSIDHHDIVPCSGVRQLKVQIPNVSLHSLGKLFSNVNLLWCKYPTSLSIGDSLLMPTPLVNMRHLKVLSVIPGLEFLLDGVMLPRLYFLEVMIVPLFVALASRANQMKILDTVEHLVITDQEGNEESCFSLKQWYTVLDALPRLRTLLIDIQNAKCPPMALADLFIDYANRTRQKSLTIFACFIDDTNDTKNKEHFINYVEDTIEVVCRPVQLMSLGGTRFNAWF